MSVLPVRFRRIRIVTADVFLPLITIYSVANVDIACWDSHPRSSSCTGRNTIAKNVKTSKTRTAVSSSVAQLTGENARVLRLTTRKVNGVVNLPTLRGPQPKNIRVLEVVPVHIKRGSGDHFHLHSFKKRSMKIGPSRQDSAIASRGKRGNNQLQQERDPPRPSPHRDQVNRSCRTRKFAILAAWILLNIGTTSAVLLKRLFIISFVTLVINNVALVVIIAASRIEVGRQRHALRPLKSQLSG